MGQVLCEPAHYPMRGSLTQLHEPGLLSVRHASEEVAQREDTHLYGVWRCTGS